MSYAHALDIFKPIKTHNNVFYRSFILCEDSFEAQSLRHLGKDRQKIWLTIHQNTFLGRVVAVAQLTAAVPSQGSLQYVRRLASFPSMWHHERGAASSDVVHGQKIGRNMPWFLLRNINCFNLWIHAKAELLWSVDNCSLT